LLYRGLKITVRLAMMIFCRKIIVNKPSLLEIQGPVLLACNHPNSFLDAIILDVLFDQPIYSLARGDAFLNNRIRRLFRALKILPVYRTSEGVENLGENYKTFHACRTIFRQNGLVLIFSEGKCINEWHLRPLKKGTARLAIKSWEENIQLKVLPVGINYNSFRLFGKNIFINFGEIISRETIDWSHADGLRHNTFNNVLQQQLEKLVYEIARNDFGRRQQMLVISVSKTRKFLLSIPAAIGWLLHQPLYLPLKYYTLRKAGHNDHYDSILMALLLFTYPFYLFLLSVLVYVFTKSILSFLLLFLMPFTAWAYVQVKKQVD
jgi:1-acyl-sn-glycerol-3-phosphate acyltransferase